MKIGISTFDTDNKDFQMQIHSLLEQSLTPDFIVLHYAGFLGKYLKMYRFLLKTLRQYRFQTLRQLRKRGQRETTKNPYQLSDSQREEVRKCLNKIEKIKVLGINDATTIRKLRKLDKSLVLCNSGILKEEVLQLDNMIFLNVHASRLPQFRGMNNVEWTLYCKQELYLTLHRIARGIDEGDILYQEKIETEEQNLQSIQDYRNYCFYRCNQAVGLAIKRYLNGDLHFVPQQIGGSELDQYYVMHPLLKKRLEQGIREMKAPVEK